MEIQTGITLYGLLKLCFRTYSLPQRMQTWTFIQRYPLLLLLPLQCMNLQTYLSLKIHPDNLAAPTHQVLFLLCGVQRYLLIHIPPNKGKKYKLSISFGYTLCRWPAISSLWKPSPSVSIGSTNSDDGRTPAFPWYISSNNIAAALEKYESGSSYTPYSTYYITVFLPILPLEYEGILPVTAPLTWGFCLGLQCIFQRLKWSQCNKGQRRIITWLWQSNGLGIDPTSKWWWVLLSHAGTERTAI